MTTQHIFIDSLKKNTNPAECDSERWTSYKKDTLLLQGFKQAADRTRETWSGLTSRLET